MRRTVDNVVKFYRSVEAVALTVKVNLDDFQKGSPTSFVGDLWDRRKSMWGRIAVK